MTRPGDSASASVFVRVPRADAFAIFTEEIDQWWRTGPTYRIAGRRRGRIFLEPKLGGRMCPHPDHRGETFELSSGSRTIEVGAVTVFEPPARLALEWRGVNFAPHEKTFVEVSFEEQGEGTMVTVRHGGWSALPDDRSGASRQGRRGLRAHDRHVVGRPPHVAPRARRAKVSVERYHLDRCPIEATRWRRPCSADRRPTSSSSRPGGW